MVNATQTKCPEGLSPRRFEPGYKGPVQGCDCEACCAAYAKAWPNSTYSPAHDPDEHEIDARMSEQRVRRLTYIDVED